ncbi:YkgJ family cysteine cluster protein [Sphingomonas sp.]|uniref:YkgJ family cysteine cluster protein n=1 Tax=Sphingomonas sp. TaxID=28214 RepID=UPI00286DF82F|nr:YkgJ family cysteine cluster protein [Sphingomonas sp.]
MTDAPPPNGSALCLDCALCCHGVLHDRADLEAEEVDQMRALGIEIERTGDDASFILPCPKVAGTVCTIYDQRPSCCSGYRCGLLDNYTSGRITRDTALSYVAEAKRLLQLLGETLPPGQSLRAARAEWRSGEMLRRAQAADGEGRRTGGLNQLNMTVLGRLLDRHFLAPREPRMVASPAEMAPTEPGGTGV